MVAALAALPSCSEAHAPSQTTTQAPAEPAQPAAQAPAAGGAATPQDAAGPETAVAVGQAAPDFTLSYLVPKDGGGFETRQVTLASFRSQKNVVLAFFPAAFSPG